MCHALGFPIHLGAVVVGAKLEPTKWETIKQKPKPRVRRHACGGQREHYFEKPVEHLVDL